MGSLGPALGWHDIVPPPDSVETRERLNHVTWADDLIRIATSAETLTQMTVELRPAFGRTSSAITRGTRQVVELVQANGNHGGRAQFAGQGRF